MPRHPMSRRWSDGCGAIRSFIRSPPALSTSAKPSVRGLLAMATFVLVHGSYQGGWIWQRVATRLRAASHTVHGPSMDGCAAAGMRCLRASTFQPTLTSSLICCCACLLVPHSIARLSNGRGLLGSLDPPCGSEDADQSQHKTPDSGHDQPRQIGPSDRRRPCVDWRLSTSHS